MDLLQLPVTLVVKAPNQKIADTRVDCDQHWTVGRLKSHLSDVYPSKPVSLSLGLGLGSKHGKAVSRFSTSLLV